MFRDNKLDKEKLLRAIFDCSGMLQGSLVTVYKKCGKKGCRCERGEKHGPAYYLSYKEGGKTKMIYVPESRKKEIEKSIKAFSKYWELGVKLARFNLEQKGLIKKPKYNKKTLTFEIKQSIDDTIESAEQNKDKSEYQGIDKIIELNAFVKAARSGSEVDDS